MLVLTRKPHQSIKIGDDITITITAITDGHVQVGIDAPREVPVYRDEIYTEILAAHAEAQQKN